MPKPPGHEIVTVRCESGCIVTRCKHRVGQAPPEGDVATTEHFCRRCRDTLLKHAFHDLERSDVLVYHYVDAVAAQVVETRVILYPKSGSWDLNRGGRLAPNKTLAAAIAAAGF